MVKKRAKVPVWFLVVDNEVVATSHSRGALERTCIALELLGHVPIYRFGIAIEHSEFDEMVAERHRLKMQLTSARVSIGRARAKIESLQDKIRAMKGA